MVKADVQGSAEAVKQSLEKISNDEVRAVSYTHLAMTALSLVFPIQNFSNAIAIGFGIGINAMIALYLGCLLYTSRCV